MLYQVSGVLEVAHPIIVALRDGEVIGELYVMIPPVLHARAGIRVATQDRYDISLERKYMLFCFSYCLLLVFRGKFFL